MQEYQRKLTRFFNAWQHPRRRLEEKEEREIKEKLRRFFLALRAHK